MPPMNASKLLMRCGSWVKSLHRSIIIDILSGMYAIRSRKSGKRPRSPFSKFIQTMALIMKMTDASNRVDHGIGFSAFTHLPALMPMRNIGIRLKNISM